MNLVIFHQDKIIILNGFQIKKKDLLILVILMMKLKNQINKIIINQVLKLKLILHGIGDIFKK